MTNYCPHCWVELAAVASTCQHCGKPLTVPADYVTKLISALHHPEPFTQRRAAYILGRLRDPGAVEELAAILAGPVDPYVKGEAAYALGQIGGEHAQAILRRVTQDAAQPTMVRRTAAEALCCGRNTSEKESTNE